MRPVRQSVTMRAILLIFFGICQTVSLWITPGNAQGIIQLHIINLTKKIIIRNMQGSGVKMLDLN